MDYKNVESMQGALTQYIRSEIKDENLPKTCGIIYIPQVVA
jgi:ribosome-binding factor A